MDVFASVKSALQLIIVKRVAFTGVVLSKEDTKAAMNAKSYLAQSWSSSVSTLCGGAICQ